MPALQIALTTSLAQNIINRIPNVGIRDVNKIRRIGDRLTSLIVVIKLIQNKMVEDETELNKAEWRPWVLKLVTTLFLAEDVIDEMNLVLSKPRDHGDGILEERNVSMLRGFFSNCRQLGCKSFVLSRKIHSLVIKFKVLESELDNILKTSKSATPTPTSGLKGLSLADFCDTQPTVSGVKLERVSSFITEYLVDDVLNTKGFTIFGPGGSGKTTFLKSIQEHRSTVRYFHRVIWAQVPVNFSSSSTVFFHDGYGKPVEYGTLKQSFGNTLLIMDDLWEVDPTVWTHFRSKLEARTVLLITSRDPRVSRITNTLFYTMPSYDKAECVELIQSSMPSEARFLRSSIIENLASKCNGLPLVATKLGEHIAFKCSIDQSMENAISSFGGVENLWDLPVFRDTIFTDLKFLSPPLPPLLRKCVVYLSLFPTGYAFNRREISQLWFAEGFLPIGEEFNTGGQYFDHLCVRSILVPIDQSQDYEMNDLFRGYNDSSALNTCVLVDDREEISLANHVRHLGVYREKIEFHNCDAIARCCKRLKTFNLFKTREGGTRVPSIPYSFFQSLTYLRVVNFSHSAISQLPPSIELLKLLRYLNASNTKISYIAEGVCGLLGLQILKVKDCPNLSSLPQNLRKLVNLVYLEFDIDQLTEKPVFLGSLVNIRYLEKFSVGVGKGLQISELGRLNKVEGLMKIDCIENVKDEVEAANANLIRKPHLTDLELSWTPIHETDPVVSQSVLDALRPHEGLQELTIVGYNGQIFPSWLTTHTRDLKKIRVSNCDNIDNLSPFWQLPHLNDLELDTLPSISALDRNFIGDVNSQRFTKLKHLIIRNMANLNAWEEMIVGDFPRLCSLKVQDCPLLIVSATLCQHLIAITLKEFTGCGIPAPAP